MFDKQKAFLQSFLDSSVLNVSAAPGWTKSNPVLKIQDQDSNELIINSKYIESRGLKSGESVLGYVGQLTAINLIERLKRPIARYYTPETEEEEFQMKTIHENVLPVDISNMVTQILLKAEELKNS